MARITRYTPSRLFPLADWETDFDVMWPVTRLQREVNRLFDEVFRGFESGERRDFMWSPVMEVERRDDQYEINVELPGVRPEDVNVEVEEDMLTISGSKERKQTQGEGEYRRSERMYGSFRRSFRLPEDVRQEEIRASFRDGVLTLSLPRDTTRQQAQVRRIEVQRGDDSGAPRVEQRASAEQPGAGATH